MTTPCTCGGCRNFVAAALDLEHEIFGLKILSSALGSVRAETGLCRCNDYFCVPDHHCGEWRAFENIPLTPVG